MYHCAMGSWILVLKMACTCWKWSKKWYVPVHQANNICAHDRHVNTAATYFSADFSQRWTSQTRKYLWILTNLLPSTSEQQRIESKGFDKICSDQHQTFIIGAPDLYPPFVLSPPAHLGGTHDNQWWMLSISWPCAHASPILTGRERKKISLVRETRSRKYWDRHAI